VPLRSPDGHHEARQTATTKPDGHHEAKQAALPPSFMPRLVSPERVLHVVADEAALRALE